MIDKTQIYFKPRKTHCYSAGANIYYTIMYRAAEVGYIALQKCDFNSGTADIAYKIYPPYRKKGLGTISVSLFLDFCSKHFFIERYTAYTKRNNKGSNKILENNGFMITEEKNPLYNYYKYDVWDHNISFVDYPEFCEKSE